MRLDELEKKLANEVSEVTVSSAVESTLLREFDRHNRQRHRSFRGIGIGAIAAIAALLLAGVFWPTPKPVVNTPSLAAAHVVPEVRVQAQHVATPVRRNRRRRVVPPRESEPEFFRIPYTMPLASYERAEIVRVDLPVSALVAAGLHIATADPGARAQADLVVGEDGLARAVRLISVSIN